MNNDNHPQLAGIKRFAWLLDSSIPIPGTQLRIGLDGIIGILPGIGDAGSALLSLGLVAKAAQVGISTPVLFRMLLNIFFELVFGSIPVFGDVFDFVFKANERNVRLAERYVAAPDKVKRSSTVQLVAFLVMACLMLGGLVWLAIWTLHRLYLWLV